MSRLMSLQIYYGDPPANIYPWPEQDYGEWACKPFRESDDSPYPEAWDDMIAYQFDSAIAGQPGGIVLCDKFFRYYRSMEYSDSFKQYVRGYIDFGFPNDAQEPTYTSASVLLHGKITRMAERDLILMLFSPRITAS